MVTKVRGVELRSLVLNRIRRFQILSAVEAQITHKENLFSVYLLYPLASKEGDNVIPPVALPMVLYTQTI